MRFLTFLLLLILAPLSLAAYPVVEEITEASETASTTSHDITLPNPIDNGDLLVCILILNNSTTTPTTTSGGGTWTNRWYDYFDAGAYAVMDVQVSDGTNDGATLTWTSDTATFSASQCYRISTWHEDLDGFTCTTGSDSQTSTPDPPSHTASWGAADNLWLEFVYAWNDDATISACSTNFTNPVEKVTGNGVGNDGGTVGTCRYQYNSTDTVNPGTMTLSASERAIPYTCSVREGSGAAAANITPVLFRMLND